MNNDPEFLVLKNPVGWLAEDKWEKILGAAVKNNWSPTSNSTPKNPKVYNKNELHEAKFEDFILKKSTLKSSFFSLTVQGLGQLKWAKSDGEELHLSGKVIYIKRLDQYEEYWKNVTSKDDEFKHKVAAWASEKDFWGRGKRQVCLVVGVLLCEDVVVAKSDEEVKTLRGTLGAPLGTVIEEIALSHGVPISTDGAGNVEVATETKKENRTYFKAKSAGKKVCALELKIIKVKNGELQLTEEQPKAPQNRRLGTNDDEEEVDPDDLFVGNISPKEWEALLREEPIEPGQS
jgi:hypothetical protein